MMIDNEVSVATWMDVLESQAEKNPTAVAFNEFVGLGEQPRSISYGELAQRARAVAVEIAKYSQEGDRVIVVMPGGIEYVIAFFGCVLSGTIAVTAYQPGFKQRGWGRLDAVVIDCQPVVALHLGAKADQVENWAKHSACPLHCIAVDKIETEHSVSWQRPSIDEDDIAFLQYSSGSTGTPKGVMLTHKNLLENTQLIIECNQITQQDKFVNWLPLYHDMGFVGMMLSPVRLGAEIWLIRSAVVAQNPYLLFKLITETKATVTAGPNFIFDLAVKSISPEEKATLDLSSLDIFVNGAEPVSAKTLTKFNEYFADTGLKVTTVKPSYGMAESCLLVTATERDQAFRVMPVVSEEFQSGSVLKPAVGEENVSYLASSGVINSTTAVKVVDTQTRVAVDEGHVGEIMIKGGSVASGYWQQDALNAETFNLEVDGELGFMKTGDLGFIHNGQIYVCGRIKEMFIVKGRNYYPQDIEATAGAVSPSLAMHGGAFFDVSPSQTSNELVLVHELTRAGMKDDHEALIRQILEAIIEVHKLPIAAVILIKPMSLAKTSSGKIQRLSTRNAFLTGALKVVAGWENPEKYREPIEA